MRSGVLRGCACPRGPTDPPLAADYPWRWSRSIPLNSALIKWMYLPDFYMAPNSINLISEYGQLPLAHWHVLLSLCLSVRLSVLPAEVGRRPVLRIHGEQTPGYWAPPCPLHTGP